METNLNHELALVSSETSSESTTATSKPKRPCKKVEQKVKCQFCPRSFSTPRWNTNHCNQEHLDLIKASWLECSYCHLFLPTNNSLINHLSHIHEPKKKVLRGPGYVKCPYCEKKCYPSNHLYKHCLRYHRDKVESEWLKCPSCPLFFQAKVSLERHTVLKHEKRTATKRPNKATRCPFCPCIPGNVGISLTKHCTDNHLDVVSKIWSLCDVCGQYVPARLNKAHNRQHENGKCQFCDFIFSTVTPFNYAAHANVSHPKEVSMLWIACPDCSYYYPNEEGIQLHRKSNHPVRKEKEKPMETERFLETWDEGQCRYCGIKVNNMQHFRRHQQMHYNHPSPEVIRCHECISVFQTERAKAKHKCQPRSFVSCQFCSQSFLTEDSYLHHAKKDHGDQIALLWVACQFCPERFDSESKLSEHLCKRSICCPFCSDKVTSLKNLLSHANENHPDEVSASWSFECIDCKLRYPVEQHLRFHKTEMDCNGPEPVSRPPCLAMSKIRLTKLIMERKNRRLPEGLKPSCTVCKLKLNSAQGWTMHQKMVHGYSQVFSSVCDFEASAIEELTKHLEDTHPDLKLTNEWIRCEECREFLPKLEAYQRHRSWHHRKSKRTKDRKLSRERLKKSYYKRSSLEEDIQVDDSKNVDLATINLHPDLTNNTASVCQESGDDVSLKMDLEESFPKTESELIPKLFPTCKVCCRSFVDSIRLKEHLDDIHQISSRQKPEDTPLKLTNEEPTEVTMRPIEVKQLLEQSAPEILPPNANPDPASGAPQIQEGDDQANLDQAMEKVKMKYPTPRPQDEVADLELEASIHDESAGQPGDEELKDEASSEQFSNLTQVLDSSNNHDRSFDNNNKNSENSYENNIYDVNLDNSNKNKFGTNNNDDCKSKKVIDVPLDVDDNNQHGIINNENITQAENNGNSITIDDDVFVYTHSCKKCDEEFASKLFLIRHLYKVHLNS